MKQFNFGLWIHLGAALTSVFVQLISIPLITVLFGYRSEYVALSIGVTFLGLAFGQSGVLSLKKIRVILLGTALCALTTFLLYERILSSPTPFVRFSVIVYLLSALLCAGILISNAINFSANSFSKNYFFHNLICCIFVIIFTLCSSRVGVSVSHLILALAFSGIILASRKRASNPQEFPGSLDGGGVLLGTISGGFSCCVLQSINNWLHPSGIEFQIYLVIVFLLLALAAFAKKPGILNIGLRPILPLSIFVLILLILAGGRGDQMIFDPLLFIGALPSRLRAHWILEILFIGLLLVPYAGFALNLPALQARPEKKNYLFSITLGNCFAIFFCYIVVPSFDLQIKVGLLIALAFLYDTNFSRFNYRRAALAYLPIIVIGFFFLKDLDRRATLQSLRVRPAIWENDDQSVQNRLDRHITSEKLVYFKRNYTDTAYVYKQGPNVSYLGLNGYASSMYRGKDLARALAATEVVEKTGARRILVVGAGSQIILKSLQKSFQKLKVKPSVDVVDNFRLFSKRRFRNIVSGAKGFKWPSPGFKFHLDDIYTFMSQRKNQKPYDLIVLNLHWPNHAAVSKLFSKEFQRILSSALVERGYLISEFIPNKELLCLSLREFKQNALFPWPSPFAALVSSKTEFDGPLHSTEHSLQAGKICSATRELTLDKPFGPHFPRFGFFPMDFDWKCELAKPPKSNVFIASKETDTDIFDVIALAQNREKNSRYRAVDSLGNDLFATLLFDSLESPNLQPVMENYGLLEKRYSFESDGKDSPLFFSLVQESLAQAWPNFRSIYPHFPNISEDHRKFLEGTLSSQVDVFFSPDFYNRRAFLNALGRQGLKPRSAPFKDFAKVAAAISSDPNRPIVFLINPAQLSERNFGEMRTIQNSLNPKFIFLSEDASASALHFPAIKNSITYFVWQAGMSPRDCAFAREFHEFTRRLPSQRAGLFNRALKEDIEPRRSPIVLIQSRNARRIQPSLLTCEI